MSSILLNFDIEEFDIPLEYGKHISMEEQIAVSAAGTMFILDLLKQYQIKSTFFCTVQFAQQARDVIQRILAEGHELASHGMRHDAFDSGDYKASKQALEALSGKTIKGYRMPRAQAVDESLLLEAGYLYDSSINPTYLPGRYNNLFVSRLKYQSGALWEIPASVLPGCRFPLFWLSFHNLPLSWYQTMCRYTLYQDGYLNIYFHPWEFMEIGENNLYQLPSYEVKNSGDLMRNRFEKLLKSFEKHSFQTIADYLGV